MICEKCHSPCAIEEGRYKYYKSLNNIVYCSKLCADNVYLYNFTSLHDIKKLIKQFFFGIFKYIFLFVNKN